MGSKEIKWKKYDNLYKQMKNMIITPKGEILTIESMSHDYYLEELAESELGMDNNKIYDLMAEARLEAKSADEDCHVRDTDIIIAKLGFVSVHTSGNCIGWIQLPEKLNQAQLKAINLEYVLGKFPELLYDVLINYETLAEEYRAIFGNKHWWNPHQIDIEFVKKKEPWTSDLDFSNGYTVSVM